LTDGALVAAAVDSDRYITDRFLPDKAIDLIDEAASRLRMQQESKPDALEALDRSIIRKKMELQALRRETDSKSVKRRTQVEEELAEAEAESKKLSERWQKERMELAERKRAKAKLETCRADAERAQREGNFDEAARLLYEEIPRLERLNAGTSDAEQLSSGESPLLSDSVTAEHIARVVSRATGIPLQNLMQGERERLLNMETMLGERVIGQPEALAAICNTVRVARAGLHPHNRPIGTFLFIGPSGVGKTELCKTLAEVMFNSRNALVRIDMSEYMEKFSVSRLIGAPPGYVGYEEGGQLTEAVRRSPFSLVLLDEFEKAHPEVANLLLQLLDDGHLTDSQGRKISFKNTIIVLTSNLGSNILAELPEGVPSSTAYEPVMQVVRRTFPPEFLNRIDETVLFNRLGRDAMDALVELRVREVSAMLDERQVTIEVDPAARKWLGERGYSAVYGARPLRRAVQQYVLNPLSRRILDDTVTANSHVVVSTDPEDSDRLRLHITHPTKAEAKILSLPPHQDDHVDAA